MGRKVLIASLLLFHLTQIVYGQNGKVDSLKLLLHDAPGDTNRVKVLLSIVQEYYFSIPDSSIVFAEKALNLASDLDYYPGEREALNNAGEALRFLGDFPRSLKMQFNALQLNRKKQDSAGEATSLGFIGYTYLQFGEYRQALQYLMLSHKINQRLSRQMLDAHVLSNVADVYYLLNKPDTALF